MKSRIAAFAATAAVALLSASAASAFGWNSARQADRAYAATYNASVTQDDGLTLGRETPTTTRVIVADPTGEAPGTITVDTENRYLYLSIAGGRAVRYDVGVGRKGFEWSGVTHVGRKAEWPGWTPPAAMLRVIWVPERAKPCVCVGVTPKLIESVVLSLSSATSNLAIG